MQNIKLLRAVCTLKVVSGRLWWQCQYKITRSSLRVHYYKSSGGGSGQWGRVFCTWTDMHSKCLVYQTPWSRGLKFLWRQNTDSSTRDNLQEFFHVTLWNNKITGSARKVIIIGIAVPVMTLIGYQSYPSNSYGTQLWWLASVLLSLRNTERIKCASVQLLNLAIISY